MYCEKRALPVAWTQMHAANIENCISANSAAQHVFGANSYLFNRCNCKFSLILWIKVTFSAVFCICNISRKRNVIRSGRRIIRYLIYSGFKPIWFEPIELNLLSNATRCLSKIKNREKFQCEGHDGRERISKHSLFVYTWLRVCAIAILSFVLFISAKIALTQMRTPVAAVSVTKATSAIITYKCVYAHFILETYKNRLDTWKRITTNLTAAAFRRYFLCSERNKYRTVFFSIERKLRHRAQIIHSRIAKWIVKFCDKVKTE